MLAANITVFNYEPGAGLNFNLAYAQETVAAKVDVQESAQPS